MSFQPRLAVTPDATAYETPSIVSSLASCVPPIVVMLESPQAIQNVDEIASVKGIDVLLIGTNDLCMEMGIPGQYDHEKVKSSYKKVIEACINNNITPGMGGVYTEDLMKEYIKMGMQFILSGSDLAFMMSGAKQRADYLKKLDRS